MSCHLIMPMGGAGSRFYKNGYMQPKPLIEINKKPFLYWSTMSIKRFVEIADLTFIVLKQHVEIFHIDQVILSYFPEAKISIIPDVLPGPVFTALKGVEKINDDRPVVFNDCDHMFKCDAVNILLNRNTIDQDGILLTFKSDEPQFSYVKYQNNKIVGTIEKQVVSSHAICGAYIFKNATTFVRVANEYIEKCPYSECFMSGIYNVICDLGMRVEDFLLDYHVEFGTPEEYEKAKESRRFDEFLQ